MATQRYFYRARMLLACSATPAGESTFAVGYGCTDTVPMPTILAAVRRGEVEVQGITGDRLRTGPADAAGLGAGARGLGRSQHRSCDALPVRGTVVTARLSARQREMLLEIESRCKRGATRWVLSTSRAGGNVATTRALLKKGLLRRPKPGWIEITPAGRAAVSS